MTTHSSTRENWLQAAVHALRPLLTAAGGSLPDRVNVSCGWPSTGARSKKRPTYGECWSTRCSEASVNEIFISPRISDSLVVSATLLHELVHAAVGVEHGHRGPFRTVANALGFLPPMRSTPPSDALKDRLNVLTANLGPYPHATLDDELREIAGKPVTTAGRKENRRLLKVSCLACGCPVRMTAKWLREVGPPTCGCGQMMTIADHPRMLDLRGCHRHFQENGTET